MDHRDWGISTMAIHAGRDHNPSRAVATPVYQTALFALGAGTGGADGAPALEPPPHDPRQGNPNADEVEAVLAALERAERALVVSSGRAAIATVLETFLGPGGHVVAPAALCLETEQLLRRWAAGRGLRITWVRQAQDLDEWAAGIRDQASLVYLETPSNPTLAITDLAGVAALARARGVRTVADNTFATPVFTRPLDLGADLVVASATAYLGGHSDLSAGLIAGREADLVACRQTARLGGPTLDPLAAWLLHRGLKTLHLRVRRAADNAQSLAAWLLWQPQVARVDYPGLPDHPGHGVAARQMEGGFGAMLGFELRGGLAAARRFCSGLDLITRGVGLGGVESLIQHPASQSHRLAPAEVKARLGIAEGLLRFSVGIEDEADLKADLERGFQAAGTPV